MDIYSVLKTDHEKVKELLNELIALDSEDDYRNVLIDQIKSELIPHSRAEESVFYNSIRAVGSDNSKVMHSFKEHMEADALLGALQVKDKTDMDWKETAIKLKEALEHHIQEEEGKIFMEARKMFSEDEAQMMGKAFNKLKLEVKDHGFLKGSFDLIVNLMPPRFVNQLKGINESHKDI